MRFNEERITRLDVIYRRLEWHRVEASIAGDIPLALRYSDRAKVIYRAAENAGPAVTTFQR